MRWILPSTGLDWSNSVQSTSYMAHFQSIANFLAFRLREFSKMFPDGKYPPIALLLVDRLVQEPFLVEAHWIAVV